MKRILITLVGCTLFATSLLARTIRVGLNQRVITITQAIKQAVAGDTILIGAGTYREGNIVLNKSLVLIGENYPVLDGEGKFEILTIHADHVTIRGLRFISTGIASMNDVAAVKAIECHDLRVIGNKFENTFFGIYFANTSQSWVEDNELHSDVNAEYQIANGIHMWKCSHITINNNTIRGHRDGIYFEFVTNSLITNNHSEGNLRYGLHFMFSHNDEYRNNKFINNGAGVAVMYTKGVRMVDNTFEHNWGASSYGLLLKDIRDSFVVGNRFIRNSVGVYMEGSSRIGFQENSFQGNGYAIRLQASCDDNVFERNNFSANTFDLVSNGTLALNTITANYWDKYEGYDLNKDHVGDVPFRPVSMYGMMVEQVPTAILLWRSFFVYLMDKAEKAIPAITPENLKDDHPSMKPYDLVSKHH